MTFETDLFDALKALVGNRVYPSGELPAKPGRPYIVYTQIGGPSATYLEKVVPNLKGARLQLNVWGNTNAEVKALALQADAALTTASAFDAKPLGAYTSLFEEQTKLNGTRQDFHIWSAR